MIEDRTREPIEPETLLAALAEPGRLAVYLSNGFGPPPRSWPEEQPEFVRTAVLTSAPLAAVQAAGEAWLAEAAKVAGGRLRSLDPAEIGLPAVDSRWAGVRAATRAQLIGRGVELLLSLGPEIGVFHITDEFGAGLLVRVQTALATGEGLMEVRILEHLVYASLTYRLLTHNGAAVVVAETVEPTWSMRQVFPEHAAVWRRALTRAPIEELGGLSFAALAELVVRSTATRRGRTEAAADPVIAGAIEAAGKRLRPRLIDLLRERAGSGN